MSNNVKQEELRKEIIQIVNDMTPDYDDELLSLINQQVIQALSNVDIDDEGHAWYVDGEIEVRLDEYVSSLIKEYKGDKG